MATCPSNSTDCLLRAILSTQEKFDWNPPTFGATVAVGILALLISITTVFQAALGAGPGRLKASKRAIGPFYSRKTQTQFSFTELRFRTIAWVPIIDQIDSGMVQSPPNGAQHSSSDLIANRIDSVCGAGWLNLIQAIPLERWQWFITPCQTDYLPADVLAAPARATVRAIVELAVLGGCDSIQIVNDLPLVRGRITQLSFREHPFLGSIAVFDQFPPDLQMNSEALQKRDVLYLQSQMSFQGIFMEALLFDGKSVSKTSTHSMSVTEALNARRNRVPQGHDLEVVNTLLSCGNQTSLILGLLTWDSLNNCRGLPYSKIFFRRAILSLSQTNQIWNSLEKPMILRSIYDLLSAQSNILAYDTSVPYDSGLSDEQCSRMLGWTWLFDQAIETLNVQGNIDTLPQERLSKGKSPWYEWRPDGVVAKGSLTLASGDGNLLILPSALDICLTWLENASVLGELTPDEKDQTRSMLAFQLHEVDFWLLHHGGARSADCVFQLLMLPLERPDFAGQRHRPWGGERQILSPKALHDASKRGPRLDSGTLMKHPLRKSQYLRQSLKRSQKRRTRDRESAWGISPSPGSNEDVRIVHPDEVWTPQSLESQSPRLHPLKILPPPQGPIQEVKGSEDIPANARWTKINRRLVNPEALETKGLRFEEYSDYVIVLQVLNKEEISDLAQLTFEIREKRFEQLSMQAKERDSVRSIGSSIRQGKGDISSHEVSEHSDDQADEFSTLSDGPSRKIRRIKDSESGKANAKSPNISSGETSSSQKSAITEGRPAKMTLDTSTEPESSQTPVHPVLLASKHENESTYSSSSQPEEKIIPPHPPPPVSSYSSIGSEADKGMESLLIYRAVLFAALGALAADTSCVFRTELGKRVVQIL